MSLSGAWSGVCHNLTETGSTPFLVTMDEMQGALSGMIEAPDTLGFPGISVIYSTFAGHRSGSAVTFTQTYEEPLLSPTPIEFSGVVNARESRIEGTWTIAGYPPGRFVMDRGGAGDAAKVARRRRLSRVT